MLDDRFRQVVAFSQASLYLLNSCSGAYGSTASAELDAFIDCRTATALVDFMGFANRSFDKGLLVPERNRLCIFLYTTKA